MRFASRRRRGSSVEAVLELIDTLSRQRQELRAQQAGRDALEENRAAIVSAQWELSRALIRRHRPARRRAAA